MSGPHDDAKGWLRKGNSNADAIRALLVAGTLDLACFHAQQAAEMYLKGILTAFGERFARTHDLAELLPDAQRHLPAIALTEAECNVLTPYAVSMRYDNAFAPGIAEVEAALQIVERLQSSVLAGLPATCLP